MTLPERTLEQLEAIDADRARAVVKVTEAVAGGNKRHFKPIELIEMAPGKSLIIAGPSKALKKIPWLKLIEITPARYLLTLLSGIAIESLEVSLHDLLRDPEVQANKREKDTLHELMNLIGHMRRSQRLSKAEIVVITPP